MNNMKTTSFFTRVIIAFLLSIECISANAQFSSRIATALSAAGVAVIQGLYTQQEEQRRQIEIINRRLISEQQLDYHHNYQKDIVEVELLKAVTQTLQAEQLSTKLSYTPSEEQLIILYIKAHTLILQGDTLAGIELLRKVANWGLSDAMFDYALCCLEGTYVKKDVKTGNSFVFKAAQQNHPDALYYVGSAYYYGYEGFRRDSIESMKWLERSAQEGHLQGQVALGNLYLNANDITHAVKYYLAAANNNNVVWDVTGHQMLGQVFLNLGSLCLNGEFGKPDSAINYFDKAVAFGNADAAYILGLIYRDKKDTIASCNYLRSAALLGCSDAQALYGHYCFLGWGMAKDSAEAVRWYRIAASNKNASAICILPYIYYDALDNDSTIYWGEKPECRDSADIQHLVGVAYYRKADYENAESWWKKAASKQFPQALFCLYALNDIKGDSLAGFNYLVQACDQGYADALNDMACNYLEGHIVERDVEKARDLLRQAASKGSGRAYYNLGYSYSSKEYDKKPNWTLAADYYRQGAELNCREAQYGFAYCLKKGKGVKKDKAAADRWLLTAAKNGDENALKEIKKKKINL
jgi:hypothetical protein